MGRAVQVDFLLAGLRDSSNNPLASGRVYHYVAGTTTDKDVWTAYDKSATAAQPVVLDANGKALIFADGAYKFVIKDSADNTLYTHDNLFFNYDDGVAQYAGTTTGAANTYAGSVSPSIAAYATGQRFSVLTHQSNTSTTPTIAFNGLAAKTIVNSLGAALISGEIPNGTIVEFVYDGTYMRLLPPLGQWQTWSPTLGAAGAMTYTSTSTVHARYLRHGKFVAISAVISGTTGGAGDPSLHISPPFNTANANCVLSAWVIDGGSTLAGYAFFNSVSNIQVRRYDGANWSLGAGRQFGVSGTYEAA